MLIGACSPPQPPAPETPVAPPPPQPAVVETAVRIDSGVKYGDCAEALRRATAKPDMDVDSLPVPIAQVPPLIDGKKIPKGVLTKTGYGEVHATVLIDTIGKPDMKTFTVIMTTHKWLATSVQTAVAKWSFHPAKLAGCRIPRVYKIDGMSGKRPVVAKDTTG